MVLLDSDILVGILREDAEAVRFMELQETQGEKLSTTVINAFEMYEGAMLHAKKDDAMRKVRLLLSSLEILGFVPDVSEIAAGIFAELKKSGTMIDIEDIFISAIAAFNGERVVTRNTAHFGRIKGIKVVKW